MDSFLLISLSEPLSFPLLPARVAPHLICGDVFGVVCVREAENKSSVRYEVIAGIISIVNQEVRWRGGEGGCGKEEGGGGEEREDEEEDQGRAREREREITVCNLTAP